MKLNVIYSVIQNAKRHKNYIDENIYLLTLSWSNFKLCKYTNISKKYKYLLRK